MRGGVDTRARKQTAKRARTTRIRKNNNVLYYFQTPAAETTCVKFDIFITCAYLPLLFVIRASEWVQRTMDDDEACDYRDFSNVVFSRPRGRDGGFHRRVADAGSNDCGALYENP